MLPIFFMSIAEIGVRRETKCWTNPFHPCHMQIEWMCQEIDNLSNKSANHGFLLRFWQYHSSDSKNSSGTPITISNLATGGFSELEDCPKILTGLAGAMTSEGKNLTVDVVAICHWSWSLIIESCPSTSLTRRDVLNAQNNAKDKRDIAFLFVVGLTVSLSGDNLNREKLKHCKR